MKKRQFKGTKGNWKSKKENFNFTIDTDYEQENWLILRTSTDYPIDQANVKLIVKAPQLLEALQDAWELLEECHFPRTSLEKYANLYGNHFNLLNEILD